MARDGNYYRLRCHLRRKFVVWKAGFATVRVCNRTVRLDRRYCNNAVVFAPMVGFCNAVSLKVSEALVALGATCLLQALTRDGQRTLKPLADRWLDGVQGSCLHPGMNSAVYKRAPSVVRGGTDRADDHQPDKVGK